MKNDTAVPEVTAASLCENTVPQTERSKTRATRSELKRAIHRIVQQHIDGPNEIPLLVATGKEAASKKLLNVVDLLEDALGDDDNTLVKTMRVARNAILHIYDGVQAREFACMTQCPCVGGGSGHFEWPSYTAGCSSKDADDQSRIGGRLWDVAELLRLHHGNSDPRPVAQSTIYALKQLADELRFKEEDLEREIAKISPISIGE
jgi:hypothetical protein